MTMAIEQMKYVSILGPVELFQEFVLKHIINSNVQLEPAHKTLNMPGLIPFDDDTSLDNLKKRMRILNEKFHVDVKRYDEQALEREVLSPMEPHVIESYITELEERIIEHRKRIEHLKADIQEREKIISQLMPIAGLKVDIDEMFHFAFMKFRFGYLPRENFMKQKEYLVDMDVVTVPVAEENETLWLAYFMPDSVSPVIDNVFSALGFTRVRISDKVKGTPESSIEALKGEIQVLQSRIDEEEKAFSRYLEEKKSNFDKYYQRVLYLSKVHEVKKFSSHTQGTFFLVGWIPLKDYKTFAAKLETMREIMLSSEDPDCVAKVTPPTVMKNKSIFKPFESLVTMYGLPSPTEMDPTPLLTLTYILMFGFMFGDVGQGAIIALIGLYLYKARKSALGGVMFYVGISSTIFGFVYGSVFGSEEIIQPIWISPLHGKDTINTLLYLAVGYGVLVNLVAIIANMINNTRMRRWGKLLFDKNGLAGLLFYGGLALVAGLSLLKGELLFSGLVLVVVIILPTLMIFFKEPLEHLVMKKRPIFPNEKGIFIVESFFELFETLLSFFSGTVSFARVGAFALNHAGLSLAVWTLYHMMEGIGGLFIVIIGNAITIGLEGLIVGIQCMRLEYYEIFGRFYIGEGREFKPVRVTED
jgi:V/A-type H+-transporting ATPase subunit I